MFTVKGTLTIIFDSPFYKAIFERRTGSIYEVSQVNLGTSEPKSSLIYNLINKHWSKVHYFRQNVNKQSFSKKRINPKRLQRLAQKSIDKGISTQAQRTLQKQIENKKNNKKKAQIEERKIDKKRQFELHENKKIQKRKGH